jgi:hypothetical protein
MVTVPDGVTLTGSRVYPREALGQVAEEVNARAATA